MCLWLLVGLWSWREHDNTLVSNARVLGQLNIVAQEQTQGLFKQAETSLVAARNWMQNNPQDDPGTHIQFATLVDELRKTSNGLLDLRMVTRSGVLRYIPDHGQANQTLVTDRDYFHAQTDPSTRGFFVGKAVTTETSGNVFLLPHERYNWQFSFRGGEGVHQREIPCPRGRRRRRCHKRCDGSCRRTAP